MNIFQFRRISNRADWIETFELIDDDTDAVITDLDDVTIRLQVRDGCDPKLTAETGDSHITVAPSGVVEVRFTAAEMSVICPGTYELGLTIERDGIIEQELLGSLPVFEGVART